MTLAYIQTLYLYHDWANDRTLSAVARLTSDQRHADLKNSFASIHDTLVHMLASEWIWLSRWQSMSPSGMPGADQLDELHPLRDRWQQVALERTSFIEGLQEADASRPISYRRQSGEAFEQPLWELMCHAANHATYHRGQITTMIRQLDEDPVSTDMIAYFRSDEYLRSVST